MSKPGPGYAEGYLALFSHEVEEEAVAAAEAGDREAQATLQTAAEHAAMDLAEEKRRIFLLGWQNGLKASWEQLKEANRHASELNLEGCQGRFTHGSGLSHSNKQNNGQRGEPGQLDQHTHRKNELGGQHSECLNDPSSLKWHY